MRLTPEKLGESVKTTRQSLGVTQRALALTSGTGLRFIIELEKGKPTCQVGKVLAVMNTLGITISLNLPEGEAIGAALPRLTTDHPVTAAVSKTIQSRTERLLQRFKR